MSRRLKVVGTTHTYNHEEIEELVASSPATADPFGAAYTTAEVTEEQFTKPFNFAAGVKYNGQDILALINAAGGPNSGITEDAAKALIAMWAQASDTSKIPNSKLPDSVIITPEGFTENDFLVQGAAGITRRPVPIVARGDAATNPPFAGAPTNPNRLGISIGHQSSIPSGNNFAIRIGRSPAQVTILSTLDSGNFDGFSSVGIGDVAFASGNQTVAIGDGARCDGVGDIALGRWMNSRHIIPEGFTSLIDQLGRGVYHTFEELVIQDFQEFSSEFPDRPRGRFAPSLYDPGTFISAPNGVWLLQEENSVKSWTNVLAGGVTQNVKHLLAGWTGEGDPRTTNGEGGASYSNPTPVVSHSTGRGAKTALSKTDALPSYLSFTAGEGYKLTGNTGANLAGVVGLFMDFTDATIPYESMAATLNVVSAADSYQSYAFYFGADAAPAGGNNTIGATKGLVIELQPGGTQEWGVYDIANRISYTATGSTVAFSGSLGTRQNGSTLMGGEFPKTGDLSARLVYDEGHLIIYVNGERKLDLYLSDLPDLTGDKFGVSVETFDSIVCQVEGFAIEKPSADDIDPHTHSDTGGIDNISEADDVTITDPKGAQVLTYNATDEVWENADAPTAALPAGFVSYTTESRIVILNGGTGGQNATGLGPIDFPTAWNNLTAAQQNNYYVNILIREGTDAGDWAHTPPFSALLPGGALVSRDIGFRVPGSGVSGVSATFVRGSGGKITSLNIAASSDGYAGQIEFVRIPGIYYEG